MIKKINLRDQVKELLIKKMRSGNLVPNQTLSLAALSRELNVSVTPIREALTQLEQTNIICSEPNKGFIIPKLSKKEAKNLYELVANLEMLAVKNSTFNHNIINKLEKKNNILKKTSSAIERINLDMDFHEILTSNYNNPIALQILSELKTRIFFYEIDFLNNQKFYEISEDHHHKIIHFLKEKDINKAINMIKNNWMQILKLNTNE